MSAAVGTLLSYGLGLSLILLSLVRMIKYVLSTQSPYCLHNTFLAVFVPSL